MVPRALEKIRERACYGGATSSSAPVQIMTDPYEILGLSKSASDDDIRKAYRKLAKKYHPDINPGKADAEDRFKDISVAYALLSDPEKRARFDKGEIDATGPTSISSTTRTPRASSPTCSAMVGPGADNPVPPAVFGCAAAMPATRCAFPSSTPPRDRGSA
jgi:hypothetical protein